MRYPYRIVVYDARTGDRLELPFYSLDLARALYEAKVAASDHDRGRVSVMLVSDADGVIESWGGCAA